jgi:replication factor C large subunit
MAGGLVVGYNLTEGEVRYLAGARASDIIKAAEGIRRQLAKEAERAAAEAPRREAEEAEKKQAAKREGHVTLDKYFGSGLGQAGQPEKGRRARG